MTSLLDLAKRSLPHEWRQRMKRALGFRDMESRLRNLKRAGFDCQAAVDVGAYAGDWSAAAFACFQRPVIAVEPLPGQAPVLQRLRSRMPLRLEAVAVSAQAGSMAFNVQETNSRLATASDASGEAQITVPVDRLDRLLARHTDLKPNLLKVDVQGFELQVLAGAGDRLHDFEVIILEVSVIRIGEVPVFLEVMEFMNSRGYRLYDFLPMYYRPLDGALWQGDAFFVRDDSPLVASRAWQ